MQKELNSNQSAKLQQMAQSMFKQILNEDKIQLFMSLPPDHLKAVCREVGRLFHRKIKKKPNQIMTFLSGYHQIILAYTDKAPSALLNNLSLHFLLLSSYAMIENGQRKAAKDLLKKAINYLDSTDPDPILLTTALNNLCTLWMSDKKYYKAVNLLLRTVEVMQGHMRNLKLSNNKGQAMEDSVFLVNTYFLLSKCLTKIRERNNQDFYKQLYLQSSQTGMKKAIKYLGKESFLTKRFVELTKNDLRIQLPVFKQEEGEKSTIEQKFLRHLLKIEEMLANREPVIIKEIVQQPPPPPPPPPPPRPMITISENQEMVCQCSKIINDWHVQIQILKEKGQKLGSVVFNCLKGNEYLNLIIGQQKMFKLLTQMNTADILAQDCSLNNLTPRELIQLCIFNFVYIDDNKNIEIFPRAHSFATTIQLQLFGQPYIIFLYHIKNNDFRLAFGPKSESGTTHLEIEFTQQFIAKAFQLTQDTDRRIEKIYKQLMELKGRENNMKHVAEKEVKTKEVSLVNKTVESILRKFESFLKSLKPDIELKSILKQEHQFYKFVQGKDPDNGRFYFIRFLKNIKGFEINVENTYETHSPEGKTRAKGQILYSSYQFFRDFGIPSSSAVSKFRCFCQILTKKYDIKSYENPLTSRDIEIYQQNSINEVKIAFKTYLRQMIEHNDFILPLTACIISVNNQIPVGIKLTGYNPLSCYEVGFFIHLDHEVWKWPEKLGDQPQDYLNNVVEQYAYKREYFLVDWLERTGFRKIIHLLRVDEKDCFYVHGIHDNFMRMSNIIDLIH